MKRILRTAARRAGVPVLLGLTLLALAAPTPASASVPDPLPDSTRFTVRPPDDAALRQVKQLVRADRPRDAALVAKMLATPQASWFTGGTPRQVRRDVRGTLRRANRTGTVPTLVLYNVPGRDCSQYSSGGAGTDRAYRAWIDAVAAGLRPHRRVIVVVEPDGLANLPSDCPSAYPGQDIAALTASRIADIRYAGRALRAADPDALVYLDAGHSAWHSVGDIASRLDQAGVRDVQGFSLNVSNYQATPQLRSYASWVSQCLYYANNPADGGSHLGRYGDCASQYYPATLDDYSTWALSDAWYAKNVDQAANPPSGPGDLAHAVLDTSRNGRGPWTPTASYPDPQTWCNPPGRALGARPTAKTGDPLIDAYLWIKTPGQSDGQCNRGIAGSTTDPEWGGIEDPAAGAWFPAQALQLARLARSAHR